MNMHLIIYSKYIDTDRYIHIYIVYKSLNVGFFIKNKNKNQI
jgi:hypothetical protein